MTTIAYRSGIVAADSRETDEDDGCYELCEKLFRRRVGKRDVVMGTSGGTYAGMIFVDWYGSGTPIPPPLIALDADADFEVIILDRGRIFLANHLCRPVEIVTSYTAIGTGKMAALAAMKCGRGAREAVRIACGIDSHSGPPIVTMAMPGSHRKPR